MLPFFTLQLLIIPYIVFKIGGNNVFGIILSSHDDLFLNPPKVEPRVGILMPSALEAQEGVLIEVRRNFWELVGFQVVKLLLIHQISKHSCTFNEGQTSFDQ